jgi:hypothetical protein
MMIFKLSAIGVAAAPGSVELVGPALALAEAEALAFPDALADGDPPSNTKFVVLLSPPQAASIRQAVPTTSAAPYLFISPLNASAARSVTPRVGAVANSRHYRSVV